MSTSSISNAALESLISNYTAYETEDTTSGSELGNEDFLTLLVAQLENQNPLDPTDTSQFTDQLAQFSQVEQLINVNDKLDSLLEGSTEAESDISPSDYVGMQVTGTCNTMTVEDGSVTSGYYTLDEAAEVIVVVYDSDGNAVTTLEEGQVDTGSYLITWDGSDADGDAVDDGNYTYTVYANAGDGYEEVSSTITGTVSAIVYQNGSPYLVVGGVLLDPSNVTTITSSGSSSDEESTSILEYLGTTVSTNYPILQVDDGSLEGGDLSFYLESAEGVTITIYNASDEAVATIEVDEEDTAAGTNTAAWDGLADTGYQVSDGLYYYTVTTASGTSATTPVSGEVTSIETVNSVQYLKLGESGRLVSVSNVTSVQ